ncbi:MAG: excinuclease ABC subunit UvrC [Verrucomicrobia bacterium]|nr:excinuclease ABC subunit UvrC [Verrucomicrobiota bacterium]
MPAPEPVNLKEKLRRLPEKPGVYLMKDRLGRIIYVGKAKALKKRVSSYFQPSRALTLHPKIRALIEMIADFDTIEVKSEPEALLLEGKLIKQWKPKYNTDFTDDKRFLLVRVDPGEELPRFRLTRFKKDDRSRYFGPFAHSGLLRKTLAQMRRQFGILLGDASPRKLADGRWQLYDDVRQELYGFSNETEADDYRRRVDEACAFLDGKSREWLEALRAEMTAAAGKHEFEKAAELRDVVFALEKTLAKTRTFERSDPSRPEIGLEASRLLGEALGLPRPPRTLECFDISHISGTFVVASMVHFADGRPDKANYRRFQIKSFMGNDDFRAMEEVVGRRYRRLRDEGRPMPDLVIIDGGRGQIGAALKAFAAIEVEPPALIGLAKKHETILFPDERPPLNLSLNSPALNLLQRVRDEAHRFANTYNADLRSRKIRESILDDFPGLGPVRRMALLLHFDGFDRLKTASVEQIAEVEGFGPKLATELHAFLHESAPLERSE